ncbi:hypothetical protein Tco_0927536 [Tanacetum coccineum]
MYDIGSFIKWFCRRTGKKKLYKADLEGPAFNLVKAFHKNTEKLPYPYPSSKPARIPNTWALKISSISCGLKVNTNRTSMQRSMASLTVTIRGEETLIRNRVGDLQLGIESYQTKINLERPNWDAADYYFKEDYTIVPKPRAVVYRDRNDQRKLKSLSTVEYNKGMESRKWLEDDKRRSKDFITAIEKRLQIRRIFRSLESFVGGRIRDIDYRLINRTT